MQALILGCGEAFDERLPNTSILLRATGLTALVDCGYSVPPRVFAEARADEVDLIYISHAHADHYFGLPAVLGRWWEDGRTKPLVIVSQQPVLEQIRDVLEYGYRTLAARFQYPVEYRAAEAGRTLELYGAGFDFAPSKHAVTNYAVRIRADGKAFCYSGDGMFTHESAALFAGADLLLHESFTFDPSPVHGDIPSVLAMAKEQKAARLGLVHLQRTVRRSPERVREAMTAAGPAVCMPDVGDVLEV